MKNLFKPNKTEIKERAKAWADALRRNKKKATQCMRSEGGRCCLAVAESVAIQAGVKVSRSGPDDCYPAEDVMKFFGWEHDNPVLNTPSERFNAACLNDEFDLPHKLIAEAVENTFVNKKPVWSDKFKKAFREE